MESIDFINRVKQQVIIAILADDDLGERLVLKGGNLLQFAYELTARASTDVDISVDGEFEDFEWLKAKVEKALSDSLAEIGLVVFDYQFCEKPARISDDLKSFWGGYQCEFKLIDPQAFEDANGNLDTMRRKAHHLEGDAGSTKFKVDFSRHEFCEAKETFEIGGYSIYGYSPRMFVAEKIRAICQQMPEYSAIVHRKRSSASRARDFVDIHVICNHYGIAFEDTELHEILKKTFAIKKVPLEWIGRIKDTKEHHEPDFASVVATVSVGFDLQEFDYYFSWLCDQCEKLEPLWRE
ncbi:nucleotidyl transferase AbiEii/AbiGii toxin family protein [Botrimarina mediterranea]|uniref:Nucleotidyl transferase AbiEii toxin, Type IV TA system n=1 Tax=Botrimarina mediterranea TaxID=2528022 RepID=A0A518K5I6_9BACT|nr:nucleotidyl transferase AbiEii/AbiGii toxin family protein [Botrimarina mediterranea]QDV73059.1 hypothetical protein Spa11_12480 [Botrimarina mediterranea]